MKINGRHYSEDWGEDRPDGRRRDPTSRGRRPEHRDGYYINFKTEDLLALAETHAGPVRRYMKVCRELMDRLQRAKHWRCTEEANRAGLCAVDASYHLMKLAEALDALKEKLDQEFTEDHAQRGPRK